MQTIIALVRRRSRLDHRAVFGAFARGLARVLGHTATRARIRAVES